MFVIEKPKEIHISAWKDLFEKSQQNSNQKHNFDLFWTSALKEDCYAFAAKNDGGFLGFIVASLFEGFFEKSIYLDILFVDANFRKMGAGRSLLNKIEEISGSLEIDFYIQRIEKTNLIAKRLLNDYEKIERMIYKKV